MTEEEREDLKTRLLEAFKKYHHDSELIKGYTNSITTYDDNPLYIQLESDFASIPHLTFEVSRTWFKELFRTQKGRKQEFVNAVKAYITIANEHYEVLIAEKEKERLANLKPISVNHINEEDRVLKLDSISTQTSEEKLKENLKTYYKRTIEEFSEIRLDVVGFKLPISNYIKTPIFESNKKLNQKKNKLEKILNKTLKDSSYDEIKRENIQKELFEIEQILSKAHNIFDVLDYGKDIFILSSAGTGKTTTLRWMAHQLSERLLFDKSPKLDLPIFIELKFYTKEVKSLHQLIADTIDSYGFSPENINECNILLLLDGYDEYNHDTKKLLKEIIEFRRKHRNSRIVFTGRSQPNFSAHNIDFVTYKLAELQDEDMNNMFISYLGNDQGKVCYELIENVGVKDFLRNPLYTAFVLVLIQENLTQGEIDIQQIKEIIINKALLFETLIVQKFIRSYEADKADIQREARQNYKSKEIKTLSRLAHYMTYKAGDVEQLEIGIAEAFFKLFEKPSSTIGEFRRHNILKINGDYISFEKKEIRLFFTAKYLVQNIYSYKDFLKYEGHFKSNRPVRIGDREPTTWDYIKEYLLGLCEPKQLINIDSLPENPERVLLNDTLLGQLKLLLSILEKGYSTEVNSFNKEYILQLFNFNTRAYKKEKEKGATKKFWISKYLLLRKLSTTFPFILKRLTNTLIYKGNMDYLDQIPRPEYMWFTSVARRYHLGVNFNQYFQNYKETSILDDIHIDIFFLSVFEKGGKIDFPKNQIIQFIYRSMFNDRNLSDYSAFEELLNSTGKYNRGKFIERHLRQYFDDFIQFFFDKNPKPNYVRYIKLLHWIKKSGWSYPIKHYKSYSTQTKQNVVDILFEVVTNTKLHERDYLDKYLLDMIECIEDESLNNELSDKALSFFLSNDSNQNQKLYAFIVILITHKRKNIQILIDLFDVKQNSKLQKIGKKTLCCLSDKLRYNTRIFKQSFMSEMLIKVIGFYKKEKTTENKDLVIQLLKKVAYTTIRLTLEVISLSKTNDRKLYYSIILYLSNNEPKDDKVVNYLIQKLDDEYYGPWVYNILFRINTKYFFEFEDLFKESTDLLHFKFFCFYKIPEYKDITMHDIRELYFICNQKTVELFHLILNDETCVIKLKEVGRYSSLVDMISEKSSVLSNYRRNLN